MRVRSWFRVLVPTKIKKNEVNCVCTLVVLVVYLLLHTTILVEKSVMSYTAALACAHVSVAACACMHECVSVLRPVHVSVLSGVRVDY